MPSTNVHSFARAGTFIKPWLMLLVLAIAMPAAATFRLVDPPGGRPPGDAGTARPSHAATESQANRPAPGPSSPSSGKPGRPGKSGKPAAGSAGCGLSEIGLGANELKGGDCK